MALTLNDNPVLIVLNGAGACVSAGLVLGEAVGLVHVDPEQAATIVGAVTLFCGAVSAVVRQLVFSPATHEAEVAAALATPPPTG